MKKYFDLREVAKYDMKFNYILGERCCGKTYSAIKYVIEETLLKGTKFIYIYKCKEELVRIQRYFIQVAEELGYICCVSGIRNNMMDIYIDHLEMKNVCISLCIFFSEYELKSYIKEDKTIFKDYVIIFDDLELKDGEKFYIKAKKIFNLVTGNPFKILDEIKKEMEIEIVEDKKLLYCICKFIRMKSN